MSTGLNDLYWHDGQLHGVAFHISYPGPANLELDVSLYDSEQAPSRIRRKVVCAGVSHFHSSADIQELRDNASAGNVWQVYLKGATLWVYLADGLIEVRAERFSVHAV